MMSPKVLSLGAPASSRDSMISAEAHAPSAVADSASGAGPDDLAKARERSTPAIAAQVIALTLAVLVVLYGLAAEYAVAFPRNDGEWTDRMITAVYLVNLPVGAFALLLALLVKRGSPLLQRLGLIAACAALTLPLVVSATSWLP